MITSKREVAVKVAMSFIGIPYIWGGEHPFNGFDCSGLVQEILASVGLDKPGDQTADMLKDYYLSEKVKKTYQGCLVFFGKEFPYEKSDATHVGFMIDNNLMIEAAGGNSSTKTIEDAIRQKAYVRVRPWNMRSDVIMIADPFLKLYK